MLIVLDQVLVSSKQEQTSQIIARRMASAYWISPGAFIFNLLLKFNGKPMSELGGLSIRR